MMKKTLLKRLLSLSLVLVMLIPVAGAATKAKDAAIPGTPQNVPESLQIDWNYRYTFAELEEQLAAMAEAYPKLTDLYSIGTSWQERDLWCLEITGNTGKKENKTGIGVIANIHGGERESAASAMYTAWWFLLNSNTPYVKNILKNYVLYIVPVMNPDGYEQSFVNKNRPNLRPTDRNGDGVPFSDPYTDIDGDTFISTLYRANAGGTINTNAKFGMESPDWDKNGILGDDPRSSTIDMNRTFDYQWNRFDIETKGYENGQIGASAWSSGGEAPATEPEVKAIQSFLYNTPMHAMATLHTGIQCVLYPWCYRAYDENNPKDADIPFMKETAEKMCAAWAEGADSDCYTMDSYHDYITSAEMIDYAYGRLGIHAYTIEVYDEDKWEDTPETKDVFHTYAELKAMGLDVEHITDANGVGLKEGEGLWFRTSSVDQMVHRAPEHQDQMCEGTLQSILVMIESEPHGDGAQVPRYVR